MWTTRRHILAFGGCNLLAGFLRASVPGVSGRAFDVDRLLEGYATEHGSAYRRVAFWKYVASATVTLFSIPLVSKTSVGSGYAVVEEADTPAGHTLSIQFGAGSFPESARGLNRLGFIQEAIVEEQPGTPAECAWMAFMTTSRESNLDQAKKALEASGAMVPYSVAGLRAGWPISIARGPP